MRQTYFFLFFALTMFRAYPQNNSYYDLPVEFKDVAAQTFEKVSPATKQWFADMATQHPPGAFDTVWAKHKLKEKFGIAAVNQTGELFMVMMAYQRMASKEAREDRKMATADKQSDLANKENKLKLENTKIDQSKKESEEKASNLMDGANNGLVSGIVAGSVTIASTDAFFPRSHNNDLQKIPNTSTAKSTTVKVQQIDSPKLKTKNINTNEPVQNAEKEKASAEETKKTSEGHNQAMKDAVKKLQDQMEMISRNVRL